MEEFPDLSEVSAVYLNLKQIFSMSLASSFPPHRPFDCTIGLLPGTSLPSGNLYSLSVPERKAMEDYISSASALEIIRLSSPPVCFLWRTRMTFCFFPNLNKNTPMTASYQVVCQGGEMQVSPTVNILPRVHSQGGVGPDGSGEDPNSCRVAPNSQLEGGTAFPGFCKLLPAF